MIHGTFTFQFSEIDVRMTLHRGYEDENGNYVDDYTDEDWLDTVKEAAGKHKIRLVMQHEGLQTALESPWFEAEIDGEYREEAMRELMAVAAQCILNLPRPLHVNHDSQTTHTKPEMGEVVPTEPVQPDEIRAG